MSYESPVEIVWREWTTQVSDSIVRISNDYGIKVNKDELIKALEYDRDQYDKGYTDALHLDSYKWHDLRTDKPYYPENKGDARQVLTVTPSFVKDGVQHYMYRTCFACLVKTDKDIIAWREIDEFKELGGTDD